MNVSELTTLIAKVKRGASVMFTTINTPPTGASMYGVVTIGARYDAGADSEQGFHTVEELRDILERAAR